MSLSKTVKSDAKRYFNPAFYSVYFLCQLQPFTSPYKSSVPDSPARMGPEKTKQQIKVYYIHYTIIYILHFLAIV